MRNDVFVAEVLAKCEVLKRARMWPAEPRMRPALWLRNFDEDDRVAAAVLLDKFTFYNAQQTDALLVASFNALGDGKPKGPRYQTRQDLLAAVNDSVFTPVLGERPDPTDSGNFLCRRARQLLFPGATTVVAEDAIEHAYRGKPVIFVDDFIGSGDQFLSTWTRQYNGRSFRDAAASVGFIAIYVALVSTRYGLENIHRSAPEVTVSVTHILDPRSTLDGFLGANPKMDMPVRTLLDKYAARLTPREPYIAREPAYLRYGYKCRKLLLAFDHSVPDATLPVFWSPGQPNWEPLIERT